ncbi:MAG: DUF4870 domain-containing protein [Brachymonas sp.]|nr:DUF4870 domain-containing protein [Brachymonas sp.]
MDPVLNDEVSKDSRNIAVMGWVGSIFFGFIPGLIIYLVKENDAYVKDQAKEMLNWGITSAIGWVVSAILTMVVIGVFGFFAIAICHVVFCIMGAVAASNGKGFKVPFTLRLLK